jgi:hypothetical protein
MPRFPIQGNKDNDCMLVDLLSKRYKSVHVAPFKNTIAENPKLTRKQIKLNPEKKKKQCKNKQQQSSKHSFPWQR